MKMFLLFSLLAMNIASASEVHPRCALMLSSDAPNTGFQFIKADGERVIGIYTSPLKQQSNVLSVTLSWRGSSSTSAVAEFAKIVRSQYQNDIDEIFSAKVNDKTVRQQNSAPSSSFWSQALYRFKRKQAGSVHHESMTYVLMPRKDILSPIVFWSERNDHEGIPPEVSIQIESRAVSRPVFREAIKNLIHQTSAFTITDESIEEAFTILENNSYKSEAD